MSLLRPEDGFFQPKNTFLFQLVIWQPGGKAEAGGEDAVPEAREGQQEPAVIFGNVP